MTILTKAFDLEVTLYTSARGDNGDLVTNRITTHHAYDDIPETQPEGYTWAQMHAQARIQAKHACKAPRVFEVRVFASITQSEGLPTKTPPQESWAYTKRETIFEKGHGHRPHLACPHCGSSHIGEDEFFNPDTLTLTMDCFTCHREWTEYFAFTHWS